MAESLLSVRDLTVRFHTRSGVFTAVDGVSFDMAAGSVLGVVGESGSGKSVTALSLLRLLPDHSAEVTRGSIVFAGRDLLAMPEREMRHVRGREIAMIFQDPMSSLNPIFSIGHQLREPLRLHLGLSRSAADDRAEELLGLVRIPSPREVLKNYPHELSGGMRQRVMIAMALACGPKLLIADEPTTALDVTTQAQILDLLRDVRERLGVAVMLITHDLGVVAEFADTVQVMYAGRIVERAPVLSLFDRPAHPYTEGLLASMPPFEDEDPERLAAIEGTAASPFALPSGCAFHPRCKYVRDDCTRHVPPLDRIAEARDVACLHQLVVMA